MQISLNAATAVLPPVTTSPAQESRAYRLACGFFNTLDSVFDLRTSYMDVRRFQAVSHAEGSYDASVRLATAVSFTCYAITSGLRALSQVALFLGQDTFTRLGALQLVQSLPLIILSSIFGFITNTITTYYEGKSFSRELAFISLCDKKELETLSGKTSEDFELTLPSNKIGDELYFILSSGRKTFTELQQEIEKAKNSPEAATHLLAEMRSAAVKKCVTHFLGMIGAALALVASIAVFIGCPYVPLILLALSTAFTIGRFIAARYSLHESRPTLNNVKV